MDFFKLNRAKHNQEQNSFGDNVTNLEEQFNQYIDNKHFSADKILLLLKESKNFYDLQKAINKKVTKKLSLEKIINLKPIEFLFLTDEKVIQILDIMSESKQKLDQIKSKMIYPNIKRILLKNDKNATNLIKYIKREQIMYFDKELLKKIPIDNIKKFGPQQINYLTPEQFGILLDREDCSEYICNDIGFREILAHQTSIISKLSYRKITELTEDEINSLNPNSIKIILKQSYNAQKMLQTLKRGGMSSEGKTIELTKDEQDSQQSLKTISNKLQEFQKTLRTSSNFLGLRNSIPGIINIELQKMKNQNATPQQITENLDYLIDHIGQEQIQYLDDYVLTNLPKESILFSPKQVKSFSSAQCLTLLKRNDCSDYIIDNLTAEQIYGMDLKNISGLQVDTIKKFITTHQKFLFVDDFDVYMNNLNINYRDKIDKNNQNLMDRQYTEKYAQINIQFNQFRKNIMPLIENLLDKNDFTDLILPMLKPYHFSKLSKEALKKLIYNKKLDLHKQNISTDTLKKWFDIQICIPQSQQINGEWICAQLQDLTDENYQLAYKLINQAFKNKNHDQKVMWPYLVTIHKKRVVSDIQKFNKNLLTNKKNEGNKTKLEKLIGQLNLQFAGKEVAENFSDDTIKLLTTKQISLIIEHNALKYFPEGRINLFSKEEILKLDSASMKNLSQLAIKIKKTKSHYQKAINKFVDTYISGFSSQQLKSLLENGDSFLSPDTIQKIRPEILFSDNEDDKKSILWKINAMNLDFSKFKDLFFKDNFFTVDVCKKFSSEQIEQLVKSEKIKYLHPEFLADLSNEQIGMFNTEFLTEYQISTIKKKGKFEYLNNVVNLDFSKFKDLFFKDNFFTVDVCKKFSSKQIEQLVKSEKIKYLDPKFLVGLSNEQIRIFNTEFLTEYQISILIEKNKFRYLNTEIINNNNLTACFKRVSSSNVFSDDQQKELINHNNFRSLNTNVLRNFDSGLIVSKFNDKNNTIKMTSEQNLALIDNLVQNNKITELNPDVIKTFTNDQIKKLGQYSKENKSKENKSFDLTDAQIEVLVNNNQIRYFDAKFVAPKLTAEQIKNISSIITENQYVHVREDNSKFNITIEQFIALSNTNKLCYIPTSAFYFDNNLSNFNNYWCQNLSLENATAEQINILCENNNLILSETQIEQILKHAESAKTNPDIIKKIGTNVTGQQLKKLNFENVDNKQLENFFAGCQNNNNLKDDNIDNFFENIAKDNKNNKIDTLVGIKSFQKFYLKKKYSANVLDEIILRDTKSSFAKDKLFLRMVQNKFSISENQNDNSKINNFDTPIQPQMKKSYKKFIKSLSNEEIKSFRLNEVTQNFVDYLPIEKLADLDVTGNNLSKAIQDKLKRKKNRIEWWVKFWNHVPLIGYLYRKSKQSLLNNINSKLPSIPESYGLISELNKTRAKINNTKVDNEDKTNTNTKKENDNYETNITNSSQEK